MRWDGLGRVHDVKDRDHSPNRDTDTAERDCQSYLPAAGLNKI